MSPTKQEKTTRKYSVENDLRRRLDGIRLHPLIGHSLINGGRRFLDDHPNCAKTRWDFARSAIPVMQRAGVTVLVDPKVEIPDWLPDAEQKLARRGNERPIWMPTLTFPGSFELWDYLVAGLKGEEIVWVKEKRLPKPAWNLD
jgi:hypothetical protein